MHISVEISSGEKAVSCSLARINNAKSLFLLVVEMLSSRILRKKEPPNRQKEAAIPRDLETGNVTVR